MNRDMAERTARMERVWQKHLGGETVTLEEFAQQRDWLDPADLELDAPSGLVPDDAPTTRDVMGPTDRGRRG